MQITLTQEESEQFFLTALCNLSYVCSGYDLTLVYDFDHYNKVKKTGDCFEDVLLRILKDGGSLALLDNENDDVSSVNLTDVHEWVQQIPAINIANFITENGDANDDDILIQTVFFKEVIYG